MTCRSHNHVHAAVKMALTCSSELLPFFFKILIPQFNILCLINLLKILVCNEVPEEPVLSPVSNNVFERRLIVKYIHENGTDPINGEPLTEDQLLEIKGKCKSERYMQEERVRFQLMRTYSFFPLVYSKSSGKATSTFSY